MRVFQRVFPRLRVRAVEPRPAERAVSENPYLIARREWDERYGDLLMRARNWRVIAVIVGIIAIVQGAGLIYVSSRSQVVPFVVAVDNLDRVVAAGPARQTATMDERIVRAALSRWIEDLRLVTSDGIAERRAIDHVYSMIGSGTPAQVLITDYFSKDPPTERSAHETVNVEAKAVFPTSDRTYEVEWTETKRSLAGQVLSREEWKGAITIALNPPKEERLARVNPLGIYVINISWSKVL